MVKHEAHIQDLLRQRDRSKRAFQVWAALAVIWGVVLGWVAWGLIGMIAGDNDAVAWITYVVPLAVLLVGTLVAWLRIRTINGELLAAESA